jgi:hypothetical protein
MEKEKLIEKIKEYKEKGWRYRDSDDPYVICPGGSVYRARFLGFFDCPICDQFLEDDSGELEIICKHSEEVCAEIEQAKEFSGLIKKLHDIELHNSFNIKL